MATTTFQNEVPTSPEHHFFLSAQIKHHFAISDKIHTYQLANMPFKFSFSSSSSAAVAGSASVNGHETAKGWAYKHEAYSNPSGSGSRTTRQKLGEAPVTETKIFDSQGQPILLEGTRGSVGPVADNMRVEDVTDGQKDQKGSGQ